MKKGCLFYLLLIASCCQYKQLAAQQADFPVRFKTGNFITGNTIQRQRFNTVQLQASLYQEKYYVLVQFAKLPTAEQRSELQRAGVQLFDYIPGNAYLAT
ncbi:MAG TPA: hypothetical protein PLY26_05280, partial [Ferruginibacter sp.]|nr:hypothetical protein [Ferruginibacter sp.]